MPDSTRDEIARLQKEYDKNPEGRLFVHLAEAYRRSGELEKAREILKEGLERHSDYLSARIVLAQVETELGDGQRAMEVWQEVIELDPDNELALWALAELQYNGGNAEQSLLYYRRLTDLGVDDAELDEMIALLESTVAEGAAVGAGTARAPGREVVGAASGSARGQAGGDQASNQEPSKQHGPVGEPGAKGAEPTRGGSPASHSGGGSGSAGGPGGAQPPAGAGRAAASSAGSAGGAAGAGAGGPASDAAASAPSGVGHEGASGSSAGGTSDAGRARGATPDHIRRRNGENGSTALTHTDAIGLSDLLVRLLEYSDATFHAGSSLTRLLAISIGRELELEQIHLEALALAALLSDLGGLGLTSGDGQRLTDLQDADARRKAEQREVAISLQLLQGITLPAGVHESVRHQHERWDGKGYPDGLREEEIPYGARVIAIARACAAYLARAAENGGVASALDELQRNAGSRYDPVVVSVLRRVFQRRSDHGIGFGLGGRVLIVHPEELRALGVATQLHSEGYIAELTRDAAHARESIRRSHPKAVVLGANLPSDDLARLIRELRGNPELSATPLIVIDANDMDLRVALLTAGADVCSASDVSFREFKATLDALLRRREEIDRPGERMSRVEARF